MKVSFRKDDIKVGGKHLNLAVELMVQGFQRDTDDETISFSVDNEYFEVSNVESLLNDDVVFEGFPAFIKAPSSILDEDVFSYLPMATDEENQPVKFANWKGNGENPIAEIEGEVLLRTNVNGNELTSNQLKMLLNEDGIEVLGKKETLYIMTNED